jgi:hypothetical protein
MIVNDDRCVNTKNNGAFPLDMACLEHLSVIVAIQSTTNEQLKYLTHMFFFESHVINHMKKACSFMFSH